MELRDYIEEGAKKAGSLTELGKLLEMSQPTISGAKAHKRPMTDVQLKKLATYINVPFDTLVAANNIAMGKNVEFWRPFVQHAKAASIAMTLSIVTNLVTTTPVEAAPMQKTTTGAVCIMLSRILRRHSKQIKLDRLAELVQVSLLAMFQTRLAKM